MLELNLTIAQTEGALLRLLGTIERRGFRIESLSVTPQGTSQRIKVALGNTARPAEVLVRQLQRLMEVREVSLDIVRPAFALPAQPDPAPELSRIALRQRRGMSFLGIPERVSVAQGGVA
ncbi:ACT domain-containing protein [Pseudomarimonas salicorniae]|uniref:ACT domain-containing protein n=1 Tax=Pseudomarimonas salicorniae TaxID=2933270 RepID=A0ABT0GFE7_9GAMM|nr:ACT domain-containing protein [Lysobacter sp. CAU 1642]MCK7592767.1 ACT domain-containing protein [Lysobacter sp. CAU 1642]